MWASGAGIGGLPEPGEEGFRSRDSRARTVRDRHKKSCPATERAVTGQRRRDAAEQHGVLAGARTLAHLRHTSVIWRDSPAEPFSAEGVCEYGEWLRSPAELEGWTVTCGR